MKKGLKVSLIVLGSLAVVGVGGYFVLSNMAVNRTAMPAFKTQEAVQGDLKVSIQGTGSVQSSSTKDVILGRGGKVMDLTLEAGDQVSEGQVLFALDNEAIQDEIDSLQRQLKQQGITNAKTRDQYDDYKLYAPCDGKVVGLHAAVGEDAANIKAAYGQLMNIDVMDKINIICTIDYNGVSIRPRIELDMLVWVRPRTWTGTKVPGKVTAISGDTYTVECNRGEVPDNGYIAIFTKEDSMDWESLIGYGQSEFIKPIAVNGSGIISKVYVTEGEMVSRGDLLIEFKSTDVSRTLQSAGITTQDLREQIADKEADMLDDKVIAPIGGVIQTLGVIEGETVSSGKNIATIVDVSKQEVVIEVDELDIPKVKIGQDCEVRIDALPDVVFQGKVSKIAELGVAMNGITTYDVTVQIIDPQGIKIGMSATAEIFIDSRENVLLVPNEAIISRGENKMVRVLAAGVSLTDQSTWPVADDGSAAVPYEMRRVETGITDEINTEIISGLQSGDQVVIDSTSGSGGNNMMMGGMMMTAPAGGQGGQRSGGGQGESRAPVEIRD